MIKHTPYFKPPALSRVLLVVNGLLAVVYFVVLAFFFPYDNFVLFALLVLGEVFHVWQIVTYLHTVWGNHTNLISDTNFFPTVDIFITVAGEPIHIIRKTVLACQQISYPTARIFLLNDGFVAKRDNWREAEKLAEELEIECVTRITPGGAKAGNINNALRHSDGEFVVIFDADHVPHSDFLAKTVPYVADPLVGFVQTPQYYKNHHHNYITAGAWQQQELFFGAICSGKNTWNAATMCGTNMLIRRKALLEAGGMCEDSIAEDFVTGMFMHAAGWKSVYISEVLAEGLAPEDFLSYYKQQYRWARGALDVIFTYNVFTRDGLSIHQRLQYAASASFYLSGVVVLIDALLPLVFFLTGITAISVSTMLLALVFLPYIFVTLYTIQQSSNSALTFRSLAFSIGSFPIHLQALWSVIRQKKASFSITSKQALAGNFLHLAIPQIIYVLAVVAGVVFSLSAGGLSASFINNAAWAAMNILIFTPFIIAASPLGAKVKPFHLPVYSQVSTSTRYETAKSLEQSS